MIATADMVRRVQGPNGKWTHWGRIVILPTIELQPGAQAIVSRASVSQATGTQGVPVAAGDLKGSFSAAFGESLRESAGTLHEKTAAPQAGHGPASGVDLEAAARKTADRETSSSQSAEVGGNVIDAADEAEAREGRAGIAADSTSLAADGRLNARLVSEESGSYEAKTSGEIQAEHENGRVASAGVRVASAGVNAKAAELDSAGSTASISGTGPGPDLVSDKKTDVSGKGSVAGGVAEAAAIAADKLFGPQWVGREGGGPMKGTGAAQPKGSPTATGRGVVKAALTVESAKAGLKSGVKSVAETQNTALREGEAEVLKSGAAETFAASGAVTPPVQKSAERGASDAAAQTAVTGQLAAVRTGTDLPGNGMRVAVDTGSFAGLQQGASRPVAVPAEGVTDARTGLRSEARETGIAKAKLDDGGAVAATPVAGTIQGVDHRAAELSSAAVAAGTRSHALPSLEVSNAASGRTATAARSGAAAVAKVPSRVVEDGHETGRLPAVDDKAAIGRDTAPASVKQAGESQGARERGTLQQARGLTAVDGLRQDVLRQGALQSGGPQPDAGSNPFASTGAASSQEGGGAVTASTGVHATGLPVALTGGANVSGVVAEAHPVASGALQSAERVGAAKGVTSALSGATLSTGAGGATGAALGAINEPHRTLVATPTTLEVGVPNGTEGWLKIRAQVGEQGQVNASLAAGSSAGQEMLHRELPALNAYLHGEQLTVTAAVAERSFTTAGGGVADDAGRAMSANGGLAHGGTAHGGPAQGGPAQGETLGGEQSGPGQRTALETLEAGDVMRGYNGAAISEAGVPNSSFGGESGRWLNVRA